MRLADSLDDWHAKLLQVTNSQNTFTIVALGKEKASTGLFFKKSSIVLKFQRNLQGSFICQLAYCPIFHIVGKYAK